MISTCCTMRSFRFFFICSSNDVYSLQHIERAKAKASNRETKAIKMLFFDFTVRVSVFFLHYFKPKTQCEIFCRMRNIRKSFFFQEFSLYFLCVHRNLQSIHALEPFLRSACFFVYILLLFLNAEMFFFFTLVS